MDPALRQVTVTDPRWGELVFDVLVGGPESGEPVILLHGFPETARCWRHQLATLAAAGYRTVAPTQRGYSPGARPTEVAAYAGDQLRADVLGLADALSIDRFHLVGHDWGGSVAWQLAGRHPDRVRTLAVVSTPHPRAFGRALAPDGSEDQRARSTYVDLFRQEGIEHALVGDEGAGLRAIYEGAGLTEAESEPYWEALRTPEALGAALNWYRAASLTDVDGLGPITMPTLYVWSTEDVALGRDAADATADCVDGPYTYVVLEGVDHWVPEHAAERLDAELLALFEQG